MKKCEFTQAYDDPGLAASMVKACKLGLMNLTRPDDVLTRGEYMTILSRMLYGNKYELQPSEVDVYPFYQHHMDKIYAEGLVKLKDPEQLSQRYVVFLTLYRLAQRLVKNPQ